MKKIFILTLTISIFLSCKNPTYKVELPKESDIQNAIEKGEKQEEYLNSELQIITDLDSGIEKALAERKPILLYFTGYAVINSRKIESDLIMKNQAIFNSMKNDFINVWLYVDDQNVGKKWSEYQKENFKTNVQPYFVILDSSGNPIMKGLGYSEAKVNLETELLKNK
ncbi:hypothetical protein [Xanthomarina gelatinilytica]|uniref:hypothetical protein n=1 Tax=Xanthomarina gelatinilytica TaxID=1137281 RepID=UPI003AA81251